MKNIRSLGKWQSNILPTDTEGRFQIRDYSLNLICITETPEYARQIIDEHNREVSWRESNLHAIQMERSQLAKKAGAR
jgi:hypothetical protein